MIEKEKVREGRNLPEKTKIKQPTNNLTLHRAKVNDMYRSYQFGKIPIFLNS
jgi:hypothetical protein